MNAIAIDSSSKILYVSAKKNEFMSTEIFDVGMRQSELLLPAIQKTMEDVGLAPNELNYVAVSKGPGSFTGLRLSFSAAKAFSASTNIPVYAIDTLKMFALPYFNFSLPIVSALDAKKDRFYAAIFKDGKEIFPAGDLEPEKIAEQIKNEHKFIIAGPDSADLKLILLNILKDKSENDIIAEKILPPPTTSLFILAEEKIKNNESPLQEYEGPSYIRASEAEIKLA